MAYDPKNPDVYIFWDNSNMFIPAQDVAEQQDGLSAKLELRLHFEHMYKLAAAGRKVQKAIAVGSIPPEHDSLWDRLKDATGIEVELYERGKGSNSEQGVDQCLQIHMLRACMDSDGSPQIAVLLTGDGKGYEEGAGFHADLERLYKKGWGVEVLSWDGACKRTLKEWASEVGVYIRLDDHYNEVTFLKGTRIANHPRLTHRNTAKPNPDKAAAISKTAHETETKRADAAEAELQKLRLKEANKKKYNAKIAKRKSRRNDSHSTKG